MSETETLVERLHHAVEGDHDSGCAGRTYSCECGFDNEVYAANKAALAEITRLSAENERLRAALELIAGQKHLDPIWRGFAQ